MTREEVIVEFCKLQTLVNEKVFKCEHAADCFCPDNTMPYQNDGKVIEFIREAVEEKMRACEEWNRRALIL